MSQNQRLKEVRISLKLTQEELAMQAGVRQEEVSRMEKKAKIKDEIIQFLYRKDVNLTWLLTGEGEMFIKERRFTNEDGSSKSLAGEPENKYGTELSEAIKNQTEMLKQLTIQVRSEIAELRKEVQHLKETKVDK